MRANQCQLAIHNSAAESTVRSLAPLTCEIKIPPAMGIRDIHLRFPALHPSSYPVPDAPAQPGKNLTGYSPPFWLFDPAWSRSPRAARPPQPVLPRSDTGTTAGGSVA